MAEPNPDVQEPQDGGKLAIFRGKTALIDNLLKKFGHRQFGPCEPPQCFNRSIARRLLSVSWSHGSVCRMY